MSTLDDLFKDLKKEGKRQIQHGSSEIAAALFTGSSFVMYPPSPEEQKDRTQQQSQSQEQEREGRGGQEM